MPGRSAVEVNIENERSTSIEKDYLGDWSPEKDCCLWLTFRQPVRKQSSVTLKMASAQVVETSGTSNSPSQDSNHPDDLFRSSYVALVFKPSSYKRSTVVCSRCR